MNAPLPVVPEGFALLDRGGPWFAGLGPVYGRSSDDGVVVALTVQDSHMNIAGISHGGMLATLVDSAMGMSIARVRARRGAHGAMVTVTLTVDYLAPARVGDWIEAHTRIRKLGRQLAFVDCALRVDGGDILSASGVFALKAPTAQESPA